MYSFDKIYQWDCICNSNYIDENERNIITCWGEHNNPNALFRTSATSNNNKQTQKNLEAIFIV